MLCVALPCSTTAMSLRLRLVRLSVAWLASVPGVPLSASPPCGWYPLHLYLSTTSLSHSGAVVGHLQVKGSGIANTCPEIADPASDPFKVVMRTHICMYLMFNSKARQVLVGGALDCVIHDVATARWFVGRACAMPAFTGPCC